MKVFFNIASIPGDGVGKKSYGRHNEIEAVSDVHGETLICI